MKPNELTEKEIKKLQKKFPQIKKRIPKKSLDAYSIGDRIIIKKTTKIMPFNNKRKNATIY